MNPVPVDVVLVRPSRPANVAAACRAMKNMGLRALWFVGKDPRPLSSDARALAYGAWEVLDEARVAATLAEATTTATLVVGTSGRSTTDAWTPRQFTQEASGRAGAGRVALVFGPEATGLRRADLDLCHATVHIPTASDHPSLNLAQAVLILSYELRLSAQPLVERPAGAARATSGAIEVALGDLRQALLEIGYLNPQNPDRLATELRRLVARAGPSDREVSLLRGMARQILWAARRVAGGTSRNG